MRICCQPLAGWRFGTRLGSCCRTLVACPRTMSGAAGSTGQQPALQSSAAGAPPPPPLVIAIDGPAAAGKGTLSRRLAEALNLAHLDTGMLYRGVAWAALQAHVPLGDEPALTALAAGLELSSLEALGVELRSEEVGQAASKVSALPAVRAALLGAQRRFAATPCPPLQGAVLDGRDVGTVVCPDAPVKLFVTADVRERARRRWLELREQQAAEAAAAAAAGPEPAGGAPSTAATVCGGGGAGPEGGVSAAAAKAAAEAVAAVAKSTLDELGRDPEYQRVLAEMQQRDARDAGRAAAPLVAAPDALVLDTSAMDIQAAFQAALLHVHRKVVVAAAAEQQQ